MATRSYRRVVRINLPRISRGSRGVLRPSESLKNLRDRFRRIALRRNAPHPARYYGISVYIPRGSRRNGERRQERRRGVAFKLAGTQPADGEARGRGETEAKKETRRAASSRSVRIIKDDHRFVLRRE